MVKFKNGSIKIKMSPNIRLSLKLLLVAILSGILVIIFANLFYGVKSQSNLLFACLMAIFPITISILICRTDAVLKRIPFGIRIFGLAVFSILSGFLLLWLFLIFLHWFVAYIEL
jgi:hypothetical protein